MNSSDLLNKIAEVLSVERSCLSETTTAKELEEWDSIGTMSLLFMLDSDFGITLAPDETSKLQSVEGIVDILRKAGKLT